MRLIFENSAEGGSSNGGINSFLDALITPLTQVFERRKQHAERERIDTLSQRYSNDIFQVSKSKIDHPDAGAGLFTKKTFIKGEIVGEYTGYPVRPDSIPDDTRYVLWHSNGAEGINGDSVLRYANSSTKPNMESFTKDGGVFLRALGDIKPGEELTYAYLAEHIRATRFDQKKRIDVIAFDTTADFIHS